MQPPIGPQLKRSAFKGPKPAHLIHRRNNKENETTTDEIKDAVAKVKGNNYGNYKQSK